MYLFLFEMRVYTGRGTVPSTHAFPDKLLSFHRWYSHRMEIPFHVNTFQKKCSFRKMILKVVVRHLMVGNQILGHIVRKQTTDCTGKSNKGKLPVVR